MPFTLAHGAAALPFRRFRLIPSAVLIGTFAPDFEYFLLLSPKDRFGHTLVGGLVLTLPVSLVVLWLFHNFVKAPVAKLLPKPLQQRLLEQIGEFRFGGPRRFALIVASLLVGIATHLIWDSFTHPGTWLYYHWEILREFVYLPVLGRAEYYKLFQHLSTVIGIAILSIWLAAWYRRTQPSARSLEGGASLPRKMGFAIVVALLSLLGGFLRARAGNEPPGASFTNRHFIGELVVTAIALAWWQLVIYGVSASLRQRPYSVSREPGTDARATPD